MVEKQRVEFKFPTDPEFLEIMNRFISGLLYTSEVPADRINGVIEGLRKLFAALRAAGPDLPSDNSIEISINLDQNLFTFALCPALGWQWQEEQIEPLRQVFDQITRGTNLEGRDTLTFSLHL